MVDPNRDRSSSGERQQPPDSVIEAIERAQQHAKRALAEGVAAARALLDAVSLGINGQPAAAHPALGEVARAFDQLAATLEQSSTLTSGAARSLLSALDAEISRWEVRSRTDGDARAVLRLFLGLRELLWEMGLRPEEAEPPSPARPDLGETRFTARSPEDREARPPTTPVKRVQRVTIQG